MDSKAFVQELEAANRIRLAELADAGTTARSGLGLAPPCRTQAENQHSSASRTNCFSRSVRIAIPHSLKPSKGSTLTT